jgi:hypothetical protein
MGMDIAELSDEHADLQSNAVTPLIRVDWSISRVQSEPLVHTRCLSALIESSSDRLNAPALQASSLLLMSVVALASVVGCWGWIRRGKRKPPGTVCVR